MTSRAPVLATSSEVPSAALLFTTRISSTMPRASKPRMTSAMLSFSLYVGSTTARVLSFHTFGCSHQRRRRCAGRGVGLGQDLRAVAGHAGHHGQQDGARQPEGHPGDPTQAGAPLRAGEV